MSLNTELLQQAIFDAFLKAETDPPNLLDAELEERGLTQEAFSNLSEEEKTSIMDEIRNAVRRQLAQDLANAITSFVTNGEVVEVMTDVVVTVHTQAAGDPSHEHDGSGSGEGKQRGTGRIQ